MKKFTRGALLATGLTISALGAKHSTEAMLHHQSMEATDATIAYGLEIDQLENPGITDDEIAYFRDNEDYHATQKTLAILRFASSILLGVSITSLSLNYKLRRIEREIRMETADRLDEGINLVHDRLQSIYHDLMQQILDGKISREEAELIMLELAAQNFTSNEDEVE